jgi:tetratricopeptide (TPR) repeat protein
MTWRKLLLLIAVILAGAGVGAYFYFTFGASYPSPPEVPSEDLEARVKESLSRVREQALNNPSSADAWGTLGKHFLANDLRAEASICLAQAERLDPNDPQWPYLQVFPFMNDGTLELAVPCLRRAVNRLDARDDNTSAPRFLLGETLLELGEYDEAEHWIVVAQKLEPNDSRGNFDLGLLAIARREWQTAHSLLTRCLGSPFVQKKARVQLAAVCRRLGDTAQAEAFRQEADRLGEDADFPDPFAADYLQWSKKKKTQFKYAQQMESSGRYDEAKRLLQQITEDYPDDPYGYLMLGRLLVQQGAPTSIPVLRQAVKLAPANVEAHYFLALALSHAGERLKIGGADQAKVTTLSNEAVGLAQKAIGIRPDSGMAHMALGLIWKQRGQRMEARAEFEKAVQCNPEHAELQRRLGEILVEDGEPVEACKRFEQALLLAPPTAPWVPAVSALLIELKNKIAKDKPNKS